MSTDPGLRLFDAEDLVWIRTVLDCVERSLGESWRVLLDRIEALPLRVPASHVKAVLSALRRVIGGRAERGRVARKVRALTLGPPALDASTRAARLQATADSLGLSAADVESLLWADLAKERPVVLPNGRPPEAVLAAYANLDRIQWAVRHAHDVTIRVWGDAHALVRMAARYGLLASVRFDGEATVLEVTGPLALFHTTTIYGRALAALVPLLADHRKFQLAVRCDLGGRDCVFRVTPPVLLPPAPPVRTQSIRIASC